MNNYHKQKCEELRQIRVKMADTLGVPNVVRREPCNYEGECKGTCPACYMEEKALMDRIYELAQDGRMDMLFGEDIKVLELNATEDVMFMGDIEMGDVTDYYEDEDEDEKHDIETLPSCENDNVTLEGEDGFGFVGTLPKPHPDKPFKGDYTPVPEFPRFPVDITAGMIVPPRFNNDEDRPEIPKSPVTKIKTDDSKKRLFGRKKK